MKNTETLLNDDHFKLIVFLITSARGLLGEPCLYGPLRLLDAAIKTIEIMEKYGKVPPEILEIKREIENKKNLVMYDEEEFMAFLDELSRKIAKLIK
ncbi:hypothetical protein A3L04_04905 [Thermococcus chitonophagus]|uniref:Uncharacterized protein n=1 Tax=Thermococcus chitonophagus TaxID=54262 RepID=A0A2Z2N804_9EURY|nr:DUF6092 family protein [Thermococcus chitonophagus]ASJ16460.1 hypothetical protein A3L04_04905 [Thermococcus chitonophagus]